jgi:hypothetical protein
MASPDSPDRRLVVVSRVRHVDSMNRLRVRAALVAVPFAAGMIVFVGGTAAKAAANPQLPCQHATSTATAAGMVAPLGIQGTGGIQGSGGIEGTGAVTHTG